MKMFKRTGACTHAISESSSRRIRQHLYTYYHTATPTQIYVYSVFMLIMYKTINCHGAFGLTLTDNVIFTLRDVIAAFRLSDGVTRT